MSSNYKVTESEYFSKETEKNKVSPDNSRKRVNLKELVYFSLFRQSLR